MQVFKAFSFYSPSAKYKIHHEKYLTKTVETLEEAYEEIEHDIVSEPLYFELACKDERRVLYRHDGIYVPEIEYTITD